MAVIICTKPQTGKYYKYQDKEDLTVSDIKNLAFVYASSCLSDKEAIVELVYTKTRLMGISLLAEYLILFNVTFDFFFWESKLQKLFEEKKKISKRRRSQPAK
ncbi:MAG: hypothetical protein ACOX5W_11300 [Bacillota bacterium]